MNPLRAFLLTVLAAVLSASVVACVSGPQRDAQMRVLNVTTRAANEASDAIVLAYQIRLQACLEKSATRIDYNTCRAKEDYTFTRVRLAWEGLRRAQDAYAIKLEGREMTPPEYLDWFRVTYCNLVSELPPEVALPPVLGFSCQESAK